MAGYICVFQTDEEYEEYRNQNNLSQSTLNLSQSQKSKDWN